MKKTIIFSLLGLVMNFGVVQAQTLLPYTTGFDTEAQKNGWTIYEKGAEGGFYKWNFNTNGYSAPVCLGHDYPVGGTEITDDWCVSPPFKIASNGKIDSLRYKFSGFGMPNAGDTVAIYLLTGSADPELATSKILLKDFRAADYANDATWRLMPPLSLPASSEVCYIAFRYHTIINWLDVAFDNISISGTPPLSISGAKIDHPAIKVSPNPAQHTIRVVSPEKPEHIAISDLQGKELSRVSGGNEVNIAALSPGVYLVRCYYTKGMSAPVLFLKK
jgi:hypothetical protein